VYLCFVPVRSKPIKGQLSVASYLAQQRPDAKLLGATPAQAKDVRSSDWRSLFLLLLIVCAG
jgi:hypothetical protein